MVTHMKTTIELPDELFREVKELAREQGITMRELMVEGLRHELERRARVATAEPFRMSTYGKGGLLPGVTWENLIVRGRDEDEE